MPGLEKLAQEDFSAGIWRASARHLIDERGAYDLQNLLLDDDGSAYKRGGSSYKSNAAFGVKLNWIWDGYLVGGQRTVVASATKFGVLAADDVTMVDLGGSGLAAPTRAVSLGGLLFIGGGTIYGGSLKAADYSTGTVSVTAGSKTVTGAGTTFTGNADAGMLLRVAGAGAYYAVATVDSATQVTLKDEYQGSTAAGQAYVLSRLGTANAPYRVATVYGQVADRLVTGEGNRVYFSAGRNSTTGQVQPFSFAATDYHELGDGSQILGFATVRDQLLVFATSGLWSISNMAYNLTDAAGNVQQRLARVTSSLVLWSQEGIASWDNAAIVPAVDGVWRIDGVSSPIRLTSSITPLYVGYVRTGYKTGVGVVYRNNYLLPVLNASNAVVDLLVCRLDRKIDTRIGAVWAWTRLTGHASMASGFVDRINSSDRTPSLLASGTTTASRITDLSGMFEPAAANKNDADNTTPTWIVVTRDYPTGSLKNNNQVRRMRARYELFDAASDNPTIQAYYSTGVQQFLSRSFWGTSFWGTGTWGDSDLADFVLLATQAPEDDGRLPFTWTIEKRARYIRFRLQSSEPAARMTLRSVEIAVRQSQKDR